MKSCPLTLAPTFAFALGLTLTFALALSLALALALALTLALALALISDQGFLTPAQRHDQASPVLLGINRFFDGFALGLPLLVLLLGLANPTKPVVA